MVTRVIDRVQSSSSAGLGVLPAREQASGEFNWSLETTFDGLEHLRENWDEAVSHLGGSIYMTYDWLATWWEFYGHGKQLRLFLFRHRDELIAILPIYLETFGAGPLKTMVARLVGANIPPKAFNPPVDSALAGKVFSHVIRHLFQADRCDLLSFGPVSETSPCNSALRELSDTRNVAEPVSASYATRDVQTWFELPATFEAYLAALGSTERKNRLKRIRHLEKSHRVSSDIVSEPALAVSEFDAFVRLHARQWQAAGRAGHFAAWPRGEAYNRALVERQARQGRVRFFRMLVDGQVVSSRYTFMLGSTVYSELPAREVGEPWDKLGIGGISLIKFNESAIQSGVAAVDSGLGAYDHKAQLGGDEIPVGVWHIRARGLGGLKSRLFCLVARAILFACRKVWYRRVLPRLPRFFKRTQSLWWLRFDL
jgi:CelD/BcsL family acetyltransferase involved in cellulose biosynthesis